jgi:hypothetical protein
MSIEVTRQILERKLKAFWLVRTPIKWDNVKKSISIKKGVPYISFKLEGTITENLSIGCQREHYQMIVEVYVPSEIGTTECFSSADDINAEFRNYIEGHLTCSTGRIQRAGNSKEEHQRNVIIDLHYDHHF